MLSKSRPRQCQRAGRGPYGFEGRKATIRVAVHTQTRMETTRSELLRVFLDGQVAGLISQSNRTEKACLAPNSNTHGNNLCGSPVGFRGGVLI